MQHFFPQMLVKTKWMSLGKLDSCQATSGKKWFMRKRIFFSDPKCEKAINLKWEVCNYYCIQLSNLTILNWIFRSIWWSMSLNYRSAVEIVSWKWSRDLVWSYVILQRRNILTFRLFNCYYNLAFILFLDILWFQF